MYEIKRDKVEETLDVVTDAFTIHFYPMLFDYGTSHSFVAVGIVDKLKLVPSCGSPTMSVTMLTGGHSKVCKVV